MKKIKKIISWKPWVSGLVIGLVIAFGVPALAFTLTGSVDEFKGLFGQDQSYGQSLGGNVEATGGVCNGSEPGVTMCNVDIKNLDVTTALAVDGTTTLTATTTITKSYDGFVAWDDLAIATTSVAASYCNNTGADMFCDGYFISFKGTTNYAVPALYYAVAENSTGAWGVNWLASTTLATTTSATKNLVGSSTTAWVLETGNCLTAAISDVYNSASSTYFNKLTAEIFSSCHLMGQ